MYLAMCFGLARNQAQRMIVCASSGFVDVLASWAGLYNEMVVVRGSNPGKVVFLCAIVRCCVGFEEIEEKSCCSSILHMWWSKHSDQVPSLSRIPNTSRWHICVRTGLFQFLSLVSLARTLPRHGALCTTHILVTMQRDPYDRS
jgi:hypothetical protein